MINDITACCILRFIFSWDDGATFLLTIFSAESRCVFFSMHFLNTRSKLDFQVSSNPIYVKTITKLDGPLDLTIGKIR